MSRRRKSFFGKPWLAKGLWISIKTKSKLHNIRLKRNDQESTQKYKIFCTLWNRLKHRSKNNYYVGLALKYGNDKTKVWNLINEISNRRKTLRKNVNSLNNDENGCKIYNPELIANSLSELFSSIGGKKWLLRLINKFITKILLILYPLKQMIVSLFNTLI